MLKTVHIVENPLDPLPTIETHEVENVADLLVERFKRWPSAGRVYYKYVAETCDVTPHDPESLVRLNDLDQGPLYVVIYPQEPVTIIIAIVAVALAITAAILFRPKIPTPAMRGGDRVSSPNNALSERVNTQRLGGRIPDIYGTVRSTPDLVAVPYRVFENKKEVEYCFMCVGRGAYVISDVREDKTAVADIVDMSVEIYGPGASPGNGTPDITIGNAITEPLYSARRCSNVDGQVLPAPNRNLDCRAASAFPTFAASDGSITIPSTPGYDLTQFLSVGDTVKVRETSFTDTGDASNDLDGDYEVISVSALKVYLASPVLVNNAWDLIPTGSVSMAAVLINTMPRWVGPYTMESAGINQIISNFVSPQGLYRDDGTNRAAINVDIVVEVTPVDDNGNAGTPSQSTYTLNGSTNLEETVAVTARPSIVATGANGKFQIRAYRSTETSYNFSGQYVDEVKWRDLFAMIAPPTDTVVALGLNNVRARSSDNGATWTTPATAPFPNFRAMCVGGSYRLIAVGDSAKAMYSDDAGATWTLTQLPGTGSYNSVASDGNYAIAVSLSGVMAVSADNGATWTEVLTAPARYSAMSYYSIAYGNGRWIVIGSASAKIRYCLSLDRAIWSVQTAITGLDGTYGQSYANDIQYVGGSKFIAVGRAYSTNWRYLWCKIDATNYTSIHGTSTSTYGVVGSTDASSQCGFYHAAWDGDNTLVAVGRAGATFSPLAWKCIVSASSWSDLSPSGGAGAYFNGIVHTQTQFVAVGVNRAATYTTSWTERTIATGDYLAAAIARKGLDFGNVTTVYSRTVATPEALAVQSRKLNLLAQRMVPQRIGGTSFDPPYGTNRIDEILSAICLDQYIGNRTIDEVDFDSIYNTIDDIRKYFGRDEPIEFCYTFDKENISFEETVSMVAAAAFCTAYRRGNVIKLKFEGWSADSSILFNHRNKLPGTETRTLNFGNLEDCDGVELEYVEPLEDDAIKTIRIPEDSSAVNPKKLETVGIRNRTQATIHLLRAWNKIRYQKLSVEFEATQEANLLAIGDRILVSDSTRTGVQDGQVVNQQNFILELSQPYTFQSGHSYTIFLQHYDQTVQSLGVTAGADNRHVVLSGAPTYPLNVDPRNFAQTTYMIVDDADVAHKAFLVVEKTPQNNFTVKIRAVNYDDRYYDGDNRVPPTPPGVPTATLSGGLPSLLSYQMGFQGGCNIYKDYSAAASAWTFASALSFYTDARPLAFIAIISSYGNSQPAVTSITNNGGLGIAWTRGPHNGPVGSGNGVEVWFGNYTGGAFGGATFTINFASAAAGVAFIGMFDHANMTGFGKTGTAGGPGGGYSATTPRVTLADVLPNSIAFGAGVDQSSKAARNLIEGQIMEVERLDAGQQWTYWAQHTGVTSPTGGGTINVGTNGPNAQAWWMAAAELLAAEAPSPPSNPYGTISITGKSERGATIHGTITWGDSTTTAVTVSADANTGNYSYSQALASAAKQGKCSFTAYATNAQGDGPSCDASYGWCGFAAAIVAAPSGSTMPTDPADSSYVASNQALTSPPPVSPWNNNGNTVFRQHDTNSVSGWVYIRAPGIGFKAISARLVCRSNSGYAYQNNSLPTPAQLAKVTWPFTVIDENTLRFNYDDTNKSYSLRSIIQAMTPYGGPKTLATWSQTYNGVYDETFTLQLHLATDNAHLNPEIGERVMCIPWTGRTT